jgi:hypothetical protein
MTIMFSLNSRVREIMIFICGVQVERNHNYLYMHIWYYCVLSFVPFTLNIHLNATL